ncbi:MAG: hypothetical protein IPP48_06130 [Chitinophagaceae bacterium]|nr:hypothetical protein [Chitinophagaceae bacterium]
MHKKTTAKKRFKVLLLYALLLSAIVFSCTKLDVSPPTPPHEVNFSQKFFETKKPVQPVVQNAINLLKAENERTKFVNKLPKNCGLPIWDKIVLEKPTSNNLVEDSTVNYIIPLTITDSSLSSIIVVKNDTSGDTLQIDCYVTNDYLYNITHGTNVDTTLAMHYLNVFFYMENKAFETTTFYHIPPNLFTNITTLDADGNKTITIKDDTTSSSNYAPITWVCVEYVCTICYGHDPDCPLGGHWTICTPIYPNGGGGTGGTGGGGTSGGGGTGGGGNGGGPTGPTGCNEAFYSFMPCNPPPPDPIDEYGFLQSRKNYLTNYLASNPFGLHPCDSLVLAPLGEFNTMYQRIAQFLPNQYVRNRVDSIRTVAPNWIVDNFNIQSLDEAYGPTVNCDFFPLKVNSLPSGMTPRSFLEYFRTHINDFITPPQDAHFFAYSDGSFSDTSKWNSSYETSLGALMHIYINPDNGTVLLSDYEQIINGATEKNRFKFTTMSSPLDHEHPVAGNREFGIYNTIANPNELTFYTMAVDRTWDIWNTLGEVTFNGFEQADALWLNVQENVKNYINSQPGGNAQFYYKRSYGSRPQWDDVKDYLKGNISFETLKQRLGC